MTRTEDRTGFTLIELLIVVVIIGILASIAIPKFQAVREKSYIATLKADLRNLATQQDVYYNEMYSYSADVAVIGFTASEGVNIAIGEASNTGWSATAFHSGLSAESCSVFHGGAAAVAPATILSTIQCSR